VLAYRSGLVFRLAASPGETQDSDVFNVLLGGRCPKAIVVVEQVRCDNSGNQKYSAAAIFADTALSGSGKF